ncbi:hypothetical protein [Rossellomorea sp. BNER]|uniref:hypothetical protein n=1 Tax=Rossellomorea sp. BNER TaxID=2962031 RepID=UPI003AF22459|nr:hypothetical protein [Rossellomorea sp. BNER]
MNKVFKVASLLLFITAIICLILIVVEMSNLYVVYYLLGLGLLFSIVSNILESSIMLKVVFWGNILLLVILLCWQYVATILINP